MSKYIFTVIFLILIFSVNIFAQKTTKPIDTYDAELAKRVGADDNGMRQYVFCILRLGKTKRPGEKEMEPFQAGHFKNMGRLADEGKLLLAGPFMEDSDLRGLFILNVKTVEEAKKLVDTDPMVSAGYLEAELHPWYGSAALMEVNQLHKKIQKKKIME